MDLALNFRKASRQELFRTHNYLQHKWTQTAQKKIKQIFQKEKSIIIEQIKRGQINFTIDIKPWQDLLLALYA